MAVHVSRMIKVEGRTIILGELRELILAAAEMGLSDDERVTVNSSHDQREGSWYTIKVGS